MAPLLPQQGTAAVGDSVGTLLRYTAGTNGTMPANGVLARRKYGLLDLTGPAVNPDAAGDHRSGDGHEATRGTTGQSWKETEEGDGTQQRALPARQIQGADDEEQRPPERLRALNACSHQGGEGRGGHPTKQRAPTVPNQGPGGGP